MKTIMRRNSHCPLTKAGLWRTVPAGTEVTLTNPIAASDKDEGENRDFTFALQGDGSNQFRIDPIMGQVYFENIDDSILDRETRANYEFQVIATDKGKSSDNPYFY